MTTKNEFEPMSPIFPAAWIDSERSPSIWTGASDSKERSRHTWGVTFPRNDSYRIKVPIYREKTPQVTNSCLFPFLPIGGPPRPPIQWKDFMLSNLPK